jgi:hypothetical protein
VGASSRCGYEDSSVFRPDLRNVNLLLARDKAILRKLDACKWLTTSQVQRVLFPGISLDFVRKRLCKLAQGDYLKSFQPDRMSEALHGLGTPPKQVQHLTGMNELRLAAEKEACEFFYAFGN